jgi:hypothetical protein
VIPMGQLRLAGGAGGAVDGGQHQILAHREALVALGQLGVDELDQVQLLGLVPEGDDIAEAGGAGAYWGDRFLGGGNGLEDMVEGAQVDGFDDFRLWRWSRTIPSHGTVFPAGPALGRRCRVIRQQMSQEAGKKHVTDGPNSRFHAATPEEVSRRNQALMTMRITAEPLSVDRYQHGPPLKKPVSLVDDFLHLTRLAS